MMNPFHEVNWTPGRAERRKFATSLVIGFPCVAAALLLLDRWRGTEWHFAPALTLALVGVAVGAILWALPQIARPFYVVWYAVACAIGLVVGNALLAAVYLLIFTPLGWALRLRRKKPFVQGCDRRATTYWRDAPPAPEAERYYRQF